MNGLTNIKLAKDSAIELYLHTGLDSFYAALELMQHSYCRSARTSCTCLRVRVSCAHPARAGGMRCHAFFCPGSSFEKIFRG